MIEAIAAFVIVACMPAGELLIEACSDETSRRQRHLWWKIVSLGTAPICAAAAAFTPPDAVSMLIIFVPCEAVWVLFVQIIVKRLTRNQIFIHPTG